jgi:hypothetical protein
VDDEGRMRLGDLPFAEEIDEQLQSFEDARSYAGKVFKINNIDVVPRPGWVYDMFYDPDRHAW